MEREYSDGAYRVTVGGSFGAKDILRRCDPILGSFEVRKGDMDDVFLNVTGKKLEGGGL